MKKTVTILLLLVMTASIATSIAEQICKGHQFALSEYDSDDLDDTDQDDKEGKEKESKEKELVSHRFFTPSGFLSTAMFDSRASSYTHAVKAVSETHVSLPELPPEL